jgi:L-lactate dehydrogenase complex protein LldE
MKARNYSERSDTVYFFGTCLMDAVYPDAGMAAIRLLESLGVRVVFPPDQSCCGQPAYNSGFPREARAVARKQIRVFSGPYPDRRAVRILCRHDEAPLPDAVCRNIR